MTRNAFITGSGGGLGVAVVERFLTAGWNVTAPRRAEVDLNDPEAVRRAVGAAAPAARARQPRGRLRGRRTGRGDPGRDVRSEPAAQPPHHLRRLPRGDPAARGRRRHRLHVLGDRALAVRRLGRLRGVEGRRHRAGTRHRQGGRALQRPRALADRHAREPRVDAGVLVGQVGAAGADRGGRAVAVLAWSPRL